MSRRHRGRVQRTSAAPAGEHVHRGPAIAAAPAAPATAVASAVAWLDHVCSGAAAPAPPRSQRTSGRGALIVAHPDDEVVGAGSRLPFLDGVTVVHVTDGAPREGALGAGTATRTYGGSDRGGHGGDGSGGGIAAYRRARRREAETALAACGIPVSRLLCLACPEQGAAAQLAPLALRLSEWLAAARPAWLLTHAYDGGHPDHDATAFAVHAACASLAARGEPVPTVLEMALYPRAQGGVEPSTFLPSNVPGQRLHERALWLTPAALERKRRLWDCFVSQRRTAQWLPPRVERFRMAPRYDFTRPPHEGPLYYESFPWGTTASRFVAAAGAAIAELGLAPVGDRVVSTSSFVCVPEEGDGGRP